MKKFILIMFSLFGILFFAGCGDLELENVPVDEEPAEPIVVESDTEPIVDPDTIVEEVKPIDHSVTIETPGEINDVNKDLNYKIEVKYPVIDEKEGDNQIPNINKSIESFVISAAESFKKVHSEMETDLEISEDVEIGSSSFISAYGLVLDTDTVLSIRFDNSQYSAGAAHPNSFVATLNFDVVSGKMLSMDDIFQGEYLAFLSEKCIAELKLEMPEVGEWISEGAAPDAKNFKEFNLTEDNLIVYFNPYQVAPYAEGMKTVMIPYEELSEFTKDDCPIKDFRIN